MTKRQFLDLVAAGEWRAFFERGETALATILVSIHRKDSPCSEDWAYFSVPFPPEEENRTVRILEALKDREEPSRVVPIFGSRGIDFCSSSEEDRRMKAPMSKAAFLANLEAGRFFVETIPGEAFSLTWKAYVTQDDKGELWAYDGPYSAENPAKALTDWIGADEDGPYPVKPRKGIVSYSPVD